MKKVLVVTPDYPPKLGGLSTYAKDLVDVLGNIYSTVDVLVWHKYSDLNIKNHQEYDYIFNVNYLSGYLGKWDCQKNINIIHGSEILFYSKNVIKRFYKKIFRSKIINYFEKSSKNIFVSNFTMSKLESFGFEVDYSRDIVFHNCINTKIGTFLEKTICKGSEIVFCCIARDVAHKNLKGAVEFVKLLAGVFTDYRFVLNINTDKYSSEEVQINDLTSLTDAQREEIYKNSHVNLLLSLDHSNLGYFEGFGLTCLEAAKYGTPSIVSSTGGLPENVHHCFNGLVLEAENKAKMIADVKDFFDNYKEFQIRTYMHVCMGHSLDTYEQYLRGVLSE